MAKKPLTQEQLEKRREAQRKYYARKRAEEATQPIFKVPEVDTEKYVGRDVLDALKETYALQNKELRKALAQLDLLKRKYSSETAALKQILNTMMLSVELLFPSPRLTGGDEE